MSCVICTINFVTTFGTTFFLFIFWNKNNKERYEEREAKHNESMRKKVVSKVVQK
jgi:hypothetical protein